MANNKLKEHHRGHNLFDKMRNFLKLLDHDKKSFFDKMHDLSLYKKETPVLKEKLKSFLKSCALKKLKEGLRGPAKFLRLVYLCRMTFMHSEVSDKRFNREVIKRWKFVAHMQRLARRKMESMYKNFHVQYLAAANDLFGDEENNAGMISEFSSLSEQLGTFRNESFEATEMMKKPFVKSSISVRKYDFGPIEWKEEEYFEGGDNEMYASKTNKTNKSVSNYEILEGDADESFVQGREDPLPNKKK